MKYFLPLILFLLFAHALSADLTTQPAPNYKLTFTTSHKSNPDHWVAIITPPSGDPTICPPEKLLETIPLILPKNSTLEYFSSCKVAEGEPLRTQKEIDAVTEVCKQNNITFTFHPAG